MTATAANHIARRETYESRISKSYHDMTDYLGHFRTIVSAQKAAEFFGYHSRFCRKDFRTFQIDDEFVHILIFQQPEGILNILDNEISIWSDLADSIKRNPPGFFNRIGLFFSGGYDEEEYINRCKYNAYLCQYVYSKIIPDTLPLAGEEFLKGFIPYDFNPKNQAQNLFAFSEDTVKTARPYDNIKSYLDNMINRIKSNSKVIGKINFVYNERKALYTISGGPSGWNIYYYELLDSVTIRKRLISSPVM